MDFLGFLLLLFLESGLTGLVEHRNSNIIAQPQRPVFPLNRSLRPREASALIDVNEAKGEGGTGDEVDASAKIVCDPVGEGTSEFADCPKRTCRANVDCWVAYGKPQQCVCDPHFCGLVCLPVGSQCPIPSKPENGNVFLRDSDIGGTADYICNPGFTVMGPRQRHCLATLKWSGPEPVCTNQTDFCFTPPYMPNAVVIEGHWLEGKTSSDRADYRNGETITMTCRPGFADAKRRYSTVVCLGNQWKYEKLDCQRISCPEIEGPKNGRTLYTSDMRFQATAIQFCDDGYSIRCSEETENTEPSSAKSCRRVCQEDGTWSGKSAECIAVTCPKLHQPENGFISGYQTSVNSVVAFECAEGYELTGSKFRKCQANGKWDGEQVNCLIRDCGKPPEIRNAAIKFSSTTFNSKAYFSCDPETKSSINSSELTCGQIGNKTTWLPYPYPSCYKHCSVPDISNASITLVNLDGTLNKGKVKIGAILEHGTSISVSCQSGFNLAEGLTKPLQSPFATTLCENGNWNRKYECQPARCTTRPPNIPNALTHFYGLHHGSVVRYQCFPGYELDTNRTEALLRSEVKNGGSENTWPLSHDRYSVKCEYGVWKGEPPTCVQVYCNRPTVPEDTEIYLVGSQGRWPFEAQQGLPTHGAVVEYSCIKEDHRIEGPRFTFCIEGHWSPEEMPSCKKITHDIIPPSWLFYKP
nr:c4b binding protein beta chain [Hymenolepis microstoma]